MAKSWTVVSVYNRYRNRGGEDEVFEAEADLLTRHGCRVIPVTDQTPANTGFAGRVRLAVEAVWSRRWYEQLATLLAREKPDIVHVHNCFPVISPAIYYASRAAGVPVVQTVHNYRLICPNALCFRDGHPCEDCVGKKFAWPAILHACYQESRPASALVAATTAIHHRWRTWTEQVDLYIALTEFVRQRLIAGGWPAKKIVVKPNFVHPTPPVGTGDGDYALYVGRLSTPKGIEPLLAAWQRLNRAVPLKIIGDGPLQPLVTGHPAVEWLGRQPRERVIEWMRGARLLIAPSIWYETFGLIIIEAFAAGLPVIASNHGAMAELVEHNRTGRLFRPGDPADLAAQVEWALAHPVEVAAMRRAARAEFETKYTADRNYEMLLAIYEQAHENSRHTH